MLGPELIPVYEQSSHMWLQVIYLAVGCHYFPPGLQLPSQLHSITAPWPVPSYTAWWQRHIGANNLPKIDMQLLHGVRTHDLLGTSPTTLYPLCHCYEAAQPGALQSHSMPDEHLVIQIIRPDIRTTYQSADTTMNRTSWSRDAVLALGLRACCWYLHSIYKLSLWESGMFAVCSLLFAVYTDDACSINIIESSV